MLSESAEALEAVMLEYVRGVMADSVDAVIPPENSHTYLHGSGWIHQRDNDVPAEGGFQKSEAGGTIRNRDIANNDVSALDRFAGELTEAFLEQLWKGLYATVKEASDSVGNTVVGGRGRTAPEMFLESLRKIEFGVDRAGKVTRPQMHLHPDTASVVIPELQRQGPEFEREVEQITKEKEAAALQREAERKAKFKLGSTEDRALGIGDRLR